MIRLSQEQLRKLEQLHRSNFREFIVEVLQTRANEHVKALKVASAELYKQVQGRTQELDELLELFSPKQ